VNYCLINQQVIMHEPCMCGSVAGRNYCMSKKTVVTELPW